VKYGARRGNKDRSISLHAWKLSFKHPVSNEENTFEAPLPEDSLWQACNEFINKK
jgi:23S rRNA pseudouridine1911/1915/1917 synthase